MIVDSLPPDRFRTWELNLLAAYCTASAVHQEAVDVVRNEGLVVAMGPNNYQAPHPAVAIMNKQALLMATLATKLRLTPHSRISATKAGTEKESRRSRRPNGLLFGDLQPKPNNERDDETDA